MPDTAETAAAFPLKLTFQSLIRATIKSIGGWQEELTFKSLAVYNLVEGCKFSVVSFLTPAIRSAKLSKNCSENAQHFKPTHLMHTTP